MQPEFNPPLKEKEIRSFTPSILHKFNNFHTIKTYTHEGTLNGCATLTKGTPHGRVGNQQTGHNCGILMTSSLSY